MQNNWHYSPKCSLTISLYHISFNQFSCHNDDGGLLFPHHPPEVSNCMLQWTLCGYVLLRLVSITLIVNQLIGKVKASIILLLTLMKFALMKSECATPNFRNKGTLVLGSERDIRVSYFAAIYYSHHIYRYRLNCQHRRIHCMLSK